MKKTILAAALALTTAFVVPAFAQESAQEWAEEGYQDCIVAFAADPCATAINSLVVFNTEPVLMLDTEWTALAWAQYLYAELTEEQLLLVEGLIDAGILGETAAISP